MVVAEQMEPPPRGASTGELISRLSEQTSTLIRDEMRLATAELSAKAKHAGAGLGMFGAGGLLAFFGRSRVGNDRHLGFGAHPAGIGRGP